jgi:hypothetical protein
MRPLIALILGVALAVLAGSVLWEGLPDRPLGVIGMARDVGREVVGREPVTVVFVPDHQTVAAVRAAVDVSGIVAETRNAFAMDDGRIVAANHPAASEVIARAGWADREIRIGASAAPAIEEPEGTPIPTRTQIVCALWAAAALGVWVAWRAAAAISLEIRRFFRDRRDTPPAPPETVLVLRVDTSEDVAAIRAALPEQWVPAAMPQGFALSGGWIVTAGESVASDLARKAGWSHRVLEPFDPDPFGSTSRRCDFITEMTSLGLEDSDEKVIWSVEDALAILLSETDGCGPLAEDPGRTR